MTTKLQALLVAMKVDPKTGKSISEDEGWYLISDLEKLVGFNVAGNGSPYFNNDRGLGRLHSYEKEKIGNKIIKVRLTGYRIKDLNNNKPRIPKFVRDYYSKMYPYCVFDYSGYDVIDHKNGRPPFPKNPTELDFQPASTHANDTKRKHCYKCNNTGKRFDARKLGFILGWIKGTEDFNKQINCVGCYLYDPIAFRKAFIPLPSITLTKE